MHVVQTKKFKSPLNFLLHKSEIAFVETILPTSKIENFEKLLLPILCNSVRLKKYFTVQHCIMYICLVIMGLVALHGRGRLHVNNFT